MQYSKSVIEIIKERSSWRSYTNQLLEDDTKKKINQILTIKDFKSPFSDLVGKSRFELIGVPEFAPDEKKKIGTYGLIKGAQEFIVGAIEKSDYYKENYGYIFESIILAATDLNLGTCWLGGTFNRSLFSTKINCQKNELVPAITPIGYTPEIRRKKEKVIRAFIKADSRFPWSKIFFENTFSTALFPETTGRYETLLEMVRLAPSAGNKQPWRVLKEKDSDIFHFYVKFSQDLKQKVYNTFVNIDIGIAICHFDLTAKEVGMKGRWEFLEQKLEQPKELKYIISWIGE
ncbi:MAG: nitroreductase [Candidatus Lokiarchaeota archaeon]|nr:nitroreductase [Candidatus Lokiarchaeota archaeon]